MTNIRMVEHNLRKLRRQRRIRTAMIRYIVQNGSREIGLLDLQEDQMLNSEESGSEYTPLMDSIIYRFRNGRRN